MNKIKKIIENIWRKENRERGEELPYKSNKIGSLFFAFENNDINLRSVARERGITEFFYVSEKDKWKQNFCYRLTDDQHEELVELLSEEISGSFYVKGEIQ